MADLRVVVTGAAGRMGRMVVRAIHETTGVALSGALEREDSPWLGQDPGRSPAARQAGLAIVADPLPLMLHADAIIDFSSPAATVELAALAAQARIAQVIGTTGLTEEDLERIEAAARHAPIVRSGNMSLGVNLLAALTRRAAAALGDEFDIEIVEMHHRMKVDAPSGTALMLGEARGRKGEASRSRAHSARAATASPARAARVTSASLRSAAAPSSATTASFSPARASGSCLRIRPRTARCSPTAR